MNPRERPGKRGMVFPPSWSGEQFSPTEEEAHERLQEAEAQRAPADDCKRCVYGIYGDIAAREKCPRCDGWLPR